MARLLQLPLDQNFPWYSFALTLENATYTFELYFNSRAQRWRMSILDSLENPILLGIPLSLGRDLTGPYRYLPLPPGQFCVLDASGKRTEAGLGAFLLDHALYYLESV